MAEVKMESKRGDIFDHLAPGSQSGRHRPCLRSTQGCYGVAQRGTGSLGTGLTALFSLAGRVGNAVDENISSRRRSLENANRGVIMVSGRTPFREILRRERESKTIGKRHNSASGQTDLSRQGGAETKHLFTALL